MRQAVVRRGVLDHSDSLGAGARYGRGDVQWLTAGHGILHAEMFPFVMNTTDEIRQAYADYQQTRFGGWPYPSNDPVHPRAEGRFARHADGRIERPA